MPSWAGAPLREVAVLRKLALEPEGRLLDADVAHAHDVLTVAERLLRELEDRELAPQSPHALGVEAELEHERLATLRMTREPDLAEAALAEPALEDELETARNRQPGRRAPTVELLLARRNGAAGLLPIGGCAQGRDPVDADLVHLERPLRAPKEVGTVRHPAQVRVALARRLAHRLARAVEHRATEGGSDSAGRGP